MVIGVDASWGKRDFTAVVTIAQLSTRQYIVINAFKQRADFDGLISIVLGEVERCRTEYNYSPDLVVEDASAGTSFLQVLRARQPNFAVFGMKPDSQLSKEQRAKTVKHVTDRRRVLVWTGFPQHKEFLDELDAFPGGKHDDYVDAFVWALRRYELHGSVKSDAAETPGGYFTRGRLQPSVPFEDIALLNAAEELEYRAAVAIDPEADVADTALGDDFWGSL
jgi:predicted phage terminase large subunit-like protein